MKIDIESLTLDELKGQVKEWKMPAYRAGQIFEWIHKKQVKDFDEMTNLSLDMRKRLSEECFITELSIVKMQESSKDGTRKYLFRLSDGNLVESVFMPYKHGHSVCVSSQVGCRMGCRFCASTIDGWLRNLSASEILEQVYSISRDSNVRIDNVVIMGTGEPLDNYDSVVSFIKILNSEAGLNISRRNITLSTCGLVPQIKRLAKEGLDVTLAISLHAVNDEERRQLMPIANKYTISEVIEAADEYFLATGRRISYEYSLVRDVNDSTRHAKLLADLLRGKNAHVNLIKVNPIDERDYRSATDAAAVEFQNKLEKSGINVTIRREMGRDIDGACGQLRRRQMKIEN